MTHVLLQLRLTNWYFRELAEGFAEESLRRPDWAVRLVVGHEPPDHDREACDAVVTSLPNHRYSRRMLLRRVPLISVSAGSERRDRDAVMTDALGTAELAVDHLLDRRLSNLAVAGYADNALSRDRIDAFRDLAAERGLNCDVLCGAFDAAGSSSRVVRENEVGGWLCGLPKPVGLFLTTDELAQGFGVVCQSMGLRVPDEVALIGTSADPLLVQLSRPPLTSVDLNARMVGRQAAKMLEDRLAKIGGPGWVKVPPRGVRVRGSTDLLAIDDALVQSACRWIESQSHRSIGVDDVCRAVSVNRRYLERRFRAAMSMSIGHFIRRAHLDRAVQLMVSTTMSLEQIADHAGFSQTSHMIKVFKERFGQTPGDYRRRFDPDERSSG